MTVSMGDPSSGQANALLPYQQCWTEDPARFKVALHARRVGMSWAATVEAAAWRDAQHPVHYVGLGAESVAAFVDDYCAIAGNPAPTIGCHVVDARTEAGVDLLQSLRGLIIVDDAAWREDLRELILCLSGALIDGSSVSVLSSYNGPGPFQDLIDSIREGRRSGSLHEIALHDAILDGLYKKVCAMKGIEWSSPAEMRWIEEIRGILGPDFAAACLCREAE